MFFIFDAGLSKYFQIKQNCRRVESSLIEIKKINFLEVRAQFASIMGNVNVSRLADLNKNEYLKRFTEKTHISAENNDFWDTFLRFSIETPTTSDNQLSLDNKLEPFLESFIQSNLTSGNLGSLITVFLEKSRDLLSLSDTER